MTKDLQDKALAFIEDVEGLSEEKGRQEAAAEYKAMLAEKQAEFDVAIVKAREEYYNKGFADGFQEKQEAAGSGTETAPETNEAMTFKDGTAYTGKTEKLVSAFTYSRVFKATTWGTLMLPISLDYADWKDKFEIAEIIGVETSGTSIVAKRKVLGAGSKTQPNHPYLIRAKKSGTTEQKITKKNCTVFPAIEGSVIVSKDGKVYTFHGSYRTLSSSELAGKYYSSGGAFVLATGSLKPMRVYLYID